MVASVLGYVLCNGMGADVDGLPPGKKSDPYAQVAIFKVSVRPAAFLNAPRVDRLRSSNGGGKGVGGECHEDSLTTFLLVT